MTVTRRNFLTTTALVLMSGQKLPASVPGVAFVVLQDIPESWKQRDIQTILGHFHGKILATVLVSSHDMDRFGTDGRVRKLLVSDNVAGHLLEVVLAAPALSPTQRIRHLRAARDLREAGLIAEKTESASAGPPPAVSYFERAPDQPTDLSAYRSAGFRVRIACPETSTPAEVIHEGRDQLTIRGGIVQDLFDASLADALAALPAAGVTVLHLSLSGGAGLEGEALARASEPPVRQIDTALRRLGLYTSLARDYFLLGGVQVPRDIGLLLDPADADGHIDAFASALADRNLPFSRIEGTTVPGNCVLASPGPAALLADCIVSSETSTSPQAAATVVIGAGERNGVGPDIRMHLGVLEAEASARLDRLTLTDSDRVMRIGAADVASPPLRARLLRRLVDAGNSGHVRLHDVPGLRDRVMASDPVIRRYWSLRRRRQTDPSVARPPDAAERARLIDDAALAWRFFARHIHPATGLAAGTVSTAPGGRVNSEVTLWDVASQINALIAAADLGLVDRAFAADTIRTAIASLPTDRLDGGRLPPSNFSARTLQTTVTGFDSCDAGRFGLALGRAVALGFVDPAEATAAVQDWTLDQAVRTGWHFSHRNGAWTDTSQSHCTDYIAPGFAVLGRQVLPLYPAGDSPEAEIATLYQAASLGAISTEPYALRAIELGMDSPTRLILDALFDAQLGWFETTGQLRCVSEMPIDREPWFIYSGLNLDIDGPAAWVIGTSRRDAAVATEALTGSGEIISAKAAYLWRAVHPHPYSDQLVSIIRDKARLPDQGFSVGVYADTLTPMANYTDINTNGVILAAIAHTLRDA